MTLNEVLSRFRATATPHERAQALVAAGVVKPEKLDETAATLARKSLTPSQWAALEEVRDFTRDGLYSGMFTGRGFPKKTAERLLLLGLLDSQTLAVADADGHIRYGCKPRTGYSLTPLGASLLEAYLSKR